MILENLASQHIYGTFIYICVAPLAQLWLCHGISGPCFWSNTCWTVDSFWGLNTLELHVPVFWPEFTLASSPDPPPPLPPHEERPLFVHVSNIPSFFPEKCANSVYQASPRGGGGEKAKLNLLVCDVYVYGHGQQPNCFFAQASGPFLPCSQAFTTRTHIPSSDVYTAEEGGHDAMS